MTELKRKHLSKENREVIEDGIRSGKSARHIARMIGVSPSTVVREVRINRTVSESKRKPGANLAIRCAKYKECQMHGGACEKCLTTLTDCKHCKMRSCIDRCFEFELKMCPITTTWPYVCVVSCSKRGACGYPKCRYSAHDADAFYRKRLVSSREGIDLSKDELASMVALVAPLVKKGQSFEAIWATHGEALPVSVRSAYAYQEKGLMELSDLYLPRKVRIKKRRRKDEAKRERVDRTGHTYADFEALPLKDKTRVVQCDSVVGYEHNTHDILSIHIVARAFQLYLRKKHNSARSVVEWFDYIERLMGSADAFEAVFGIVLMDRGVEFDDWKDLEQSCLNKKHQRCRVFYCDPMESNQKSQAERNHEQLRRILPKERSDFDALSNYDVVTCCCHVNSYPSAKRANKCSFELLGDYLPQSVMDELGLARVAPDDVILRPTLMPNAVIQ